MGQVQLSDRQAEQLYFLPSPSWQRTHWSSPSCWLCCPKTECIYFDTITKNHSQNPARAKQGLPNRTCVYGCPDTERSNGGYWCTSQCKDCGCQDVPGVGWRHWKALTVSQRKYEQNFAEMTPEELSAIIDRWEGEKATIAKDITPAW